MAGYLRPQSGGLGLELGGAQLNPSPIMRISLGSTVLGELFYLEGDKLMSVRVGPATEGRFVYQAPVMVLEKSFIRAGQPPSFDVAADGRLLMLGRVPIGPSAPIEVIVNWRAQVARQVARPTSP